MVTSIDIDYMTILVDSREQKPYRFADVTRRQPAKEYLAVKTVALPTGDYSVESWDATDDSKRIIIERKSLADLYATLTTGRPRFIREVERMTNFGYAAIVIESDLSAILDPNPHLLHPTRANPRSIFGSLFAISQRYGICVWPCPSRDFAEQLTYRLLERWHRSVNQGHV